MLTVPAESVFVLGSEKTEVTSPAPFLANTWNSYAVYGVIPLLPFTAVPLST